MTTKTTGHTIASTLADMRGHIEDLARAHDALTLPDCDDIAVEWQTVIGQIDEIGEASHQLMLIARDTMLPNLKTLTNHAQAVLAEIENLNLLAQVSSKA